MAKMANVEEVYNEFLELVNNGKKPFEVIRFIDKEIKNVTDSMADDMVLALEEVQNIYEVYYQEEIFASDFIEKVGRDFESNEDIVNKAKGTEFRSWLKRLMLVAINL